MGKSGVFCKKKGLTPARVAAGLDLHLFRRDGAGTAESGSGDLCRSPGVR